MSSLFSKLREQATTIARNIQQDPRALALGIPMGA